MTQLFICHTQYNLILAIGLSSEQDDLVLFQDFNLTDELKHKLEGHFARCLFLQGNYPKKELSSKEKWEKIASDNQKLKAFIGTYDRIFIIEDMCIQEMCAMKIAYEMNKSVEMDWLEDGANAYFANSNISLGMGSTPLKRSVRKIIFSTRYHLNGFYDLGPCMGSHKCLTTVYVCFPEYVRKELANKNCKEITDEQLTKGMEFMFRTDPIMMEENCVLIAMDLLSVYGDKTDEVNKAIERIVSQAEAKGRKVYCKYHPRETDSLPSLQNTQILNSATGIENYLINATAKKMTVVGFKSTALQIARKMNYEVISLVRMIDNDCEPITSFYQSIGIECQ